MQLLFAILVCIGWYQFYSGTIFGGYWLVALVLGSLVAVWRLRRYAVATHAAHNVVAAAATFESLPVDKRNQVVTTSIEIMKRVGWMRDAVPSMLEEDDVVKFGVYALAMAELDIPPVCLISKWNLVRNPFNEALKAPYYLATSRQLASRKGFEVELRRPSHRS